MPIHFKLQTNFLSMNNNKNTQQAKYKARHSSICLKEKNRGEKEESEII